MSLGQFFVFARLLQVNYPPHCLVRVLYPAHNPVPVRITAGIIEPVQDPVRRGQVTAEMGLIHGGGFMAVWRGRVTLGGLPPCYVEAVARETRKVGERGFVRHSEVV